MTAITKQQFVDMLSQASDAALMKSKTHCHAMDVSSIVLKDDGGKLTRMFLAWPQHELHRNCWPSQNFVVGIHDHKYDLTITPFIGLVTNEVYEVSDIRQGTRFEKYLFCCGTTPGAFVSRCIGVQYLKRVSDFLLTEPVFMKSRVLHTVAAFGVAAWLVQEGELLTSETRLFTNVPFEPDPRMYQSFKSPDAVREHCFKFLELTDAK